MNSSLATAPVWINANPSFKHFDGRIVRYLSNQVPIAYWEYGQTLDEASSLEIAVTLLHDYLKSKSQTNKSQLVTVRVACSDYSMLVNILKRVKSLTLLGVGSVILLLIGKHTTIRCENCCPVVKKYCSGEEWYR